jgi:hypothetical protein
MPSLFQGMIFWPKVLRHCWALAILILVSKISNANAFYDFQLTKRYDF